MNELESHPPAVMFTKEQIYRMLLAEQKAKRRKANWAWNRYKEMFGVYPYGLSKDG
jgi:hypothetical protein